MRLMASARSAGSPSAAAAAPAAAGGGGGGGGGAPSLCAAAALVACTAAWATARGDTAVAASAAEVGDVATAASALEARAASADEPPLLDAGEAPESVSLADEPPSVRRMARAAGYRPALPGARAISYADCS